MKIKNGAHALMGSACLEKGELDTKNCPSADSSVSVGTSISPVLLPAPKHSCYEVYDRYVRVADATLGPGVWYHSVQRSEDAELEVTSDWICGPLYVDAITRSAAQNADYGRLLRLRNADGQWLQWAMPNELLAGRADNVLAVLLGMGLEVNYPCRAQVCQYIAAQYPADRVIAATSTGWLTPYLYIMPGHSIGEGKAILQSEIASAADYQQGGTLEGWQAGVGALCAGNPILMLSVCAALAGPLLYHVQRNGGGFHIVGDSSTGKSSAILAGASVWGNGDEFKRTWRATGNGLEGIASQRNDTLLALDEIGEADPREIGAVVYAMANGTGKARASRNGSARAAKRWRVILFSSGELGLSALMAEGGRRSRAGQEIRLLDIPVRRTYGAWDTLHGMAGGRELSDALQRASVTHYGHAGPLFIRKLLETGEQDGLPALLAQLSDQYPTITGQESRAAERFALLAMAGELGIRFGILPVPPGSVRDAMLELFEVWRAGRGEGPSEDRQILRSIGDFIARHGDTRFSAVDDPQGEARDRAGYWEELPSGGRLYLFNRPGLEEAVKSYDLARTVLALDSVGAITKRDAGKNQALKRLPDGSRQRLYFIDPVRLEPET